MWVDLGIHSKASPMLDTAAISYFAHEYHCAGLGIFTDMFFSAPHSASYMDYSRRLTCMATKLVLPFGWKISQVSGQRP
jgi:hypothetical protein